MDPKAARSLIATLRSAAQATSDPATPLAWRTDRDRFVDLLDPSNDHHAISPTEIRELIDFLGESVASRGSRQSPEEWANSIDLAVGRLLNSLPR
ncbi:hypothetical protein BH09ACT1_BH09ACT1_16340 [soil metagenome]